MRGFHPYAFCRLTPTLALSLKGEGVIESPWREEGLVLHLAWCCCNVADNLLQIRVFGLR